MKGLVFALAAFCSASSAFANISCEDAFAILTGPKSDQRTAELATQSGIGPGFGQQHGRAILFYCRGADEMAEQIVAQNGITAADFDRIKQNVLRQSPEERVARQRKAVYGKTAPGFEGIDKAADTALEVWNSQWLVDQYIHGTAHGAAQKGQGADIAVRGTFKVNRGGTIVDMKFDSTMRKAPNGYDIRQICWDDMGNRDCVDHDALVQRALALRLIVTSGVIFEPVNEALDRIVRKARCVDDAKARGLSAAICDDL